MERGRQNRSQNNYEPQIISNKVLYNQNIMFPTGFVSLLRPSGVISMICTPHSTWHQWSNGQGGNDRCLGKKGVHHRRIFKYHVMEVIIYHNVSHASISLYWLLRNEFAPLMFMTHTLFRIMVTSI